MYRNHFLISFEDAKSRMVERHGNKIEILEYTNASEYSVLRCAICDYRWKATPKSVWSGNGCPKCGRDSASNKMKLDYGYVKFSIESEGCLLLSTSYKNVDEKLEVKFECGHCGLISFDCFRRGHRCSICSKKRMGLSQRLSQEKIEEILLSKGLTFIEYPEGYISRKSKITHRCILGHVQTRSIASMLASDGCTPCTRIKDSLRQLGAKGPNWKGGISSLTSYLKKQITEWKKDSMKSCGYKCVICGEKFKDIHHIYNFYNMMIESLEELALDVRDSVSKYTDSELALIKSLVLKKHGEHPLGACLCRSHHKMFHRDYGLINNNEQQFAEFIQKQGVIDDTIAYW